MNVRNSYLISHAFRNYLWASLLSSAAMELTVTIDAIILGHFVGGDALAAISLIMPLTMLITALSTLIGLGPAIIASRAIGNRDFNKVNMAFTSAVLQSVIIGGGIGVGCWAFSTEIASLLCSKGQLLPYLAEYMKVAPWCFSLTVMVSTLVSLIEADGHPHLAAKALMLGCLCHVCLEVFFVGYLKMGIQGAAYAMMVNNLLTIAVFAIFMRRQGVSYRWQWPKKNIMNVTLAGLREGTPMMVNGLMYCLMLFLLNGLIGKSLGSQGLLHWAICMQVLMLVLVIVDGAEGAVLSIGGMLIGEKDVKGFYMLLNKLVILIMAVAACIIAAICFSPKMVAKLFNDGMEITAEWCAAVRIFSLMLIPHSLSVFLRSYFQVLDKRWIAMAFTALQTTLIVGALWSATQCDTSLIWWSFPVSAFLILIVQMGYILYQRKKLNGHHLLVMDNEEDRHVLELSVAYEKQPVIDAIGQVAGFLENHGANGATVMAVNICCEELMLNIVHHQSHRHNRYMDLYIATGGGKICLSLKDAGRPFNPVLPSRNINLENNNVSLGLALANSVCTTLSHKYMYGQNVVFAEFRNELPE